MRWSEHELYQVVTVRDAAWDGRFLTGVVTTGIYCLPSCPARKPRAENVRFFPSEDEARAAGLRPCRRCRPDLFYARRDPDLERLEGLLAEAAADPAEFPDAASLAAASGSGVTELVALTRRHYHATPLGLLQRLRVTWASERLLHGRERVLDIGFAAGWESASIPGSSATRRRPGSPPSIPPTWSASSSPAARPSTCSRRRRPSPAGSTSRRCRPGPPPAPPSACPPCAASARGPCTTS